MIVKIKSHKRAAFKQVLRYMIESKDRLYDAHRRSFAVTHNLKGTSVENWVKQFQDNETLRSVKRKDNVKLTHEILSWHRDDAKQLTLEKLEAMARAYITRRNPRGMYMAVPHFDKDHYHVHILASGIEYKTGKSMWMYKADFQKLKTDIQRYQELQFPELSKSVVSHTRGTQTIETDSVYQFKRRTGRATEKEKLAGMLKTCYKKADTRERFLQLIQECGLKTYQRGGRTYGVENDGIKFRFNTLGYTEERLAYLDRASARKQELYTLRHVVGPVRCTAHEALSNEPYESPEIQKNSTRETQNASRLDELEKARNAGGELSDDRALDTS